MIKKYSKFINENIISRKFIIDKLSNLKYFIVDYYGLNMRNIIDKLLKDERVYKDYNDQYQYPLSLLYKTGKFSDIRKIGDEYHTYKLENLSLIIDENGKWHPVNKLNTNYYDLSELLYDLFNNIGLIDEISSLSSDDLKKWLINFKNNNDIYSLIKENIYDIKSYIKMNRYFSSIGEKSENIVSSLIKEKGVDILYQGGDGDFIDMKYGCDLICGKNDKIYLVQVKSNDRLAKLAFDDSIKNKNNYGKIDWFCSPIKDGFIIYTKSNPNGKIIKIINNI